MSYRTSTDNHIHEAKRSVAVALSELSKALFDEHTEIEEYKSEYIDKCRESLKLLMNVSQLL